MSEKTTGGRPGNLTRQTRSFIGRGEELYRLGEELDPGTGIARLVGVVGAGGVGKTGLALRAAARAEHLYPDGVWLVKLSPLHTAGPVGLAVVEALGLSDRSTRPFHPAGHRGRRRMGRGQKAVARPGLLRARPRGLRGLRRGAAARAAEPARPRHQP
ncbi:hypothetical protein [Streptomyces sp. NBC_00687]|uniref:hypothetical protein n=1 Tax=Streptomyces sp. NBC_00687 TaxID=2975807 RepID=UPI002250B678|nr:hypothetical protein [Streptomyces sp. NBC_00687]MCX4914456.1 hypothetical protein [Streptomyces sp. NBC_00687]